jgi:hypothetical protein
MWYRGCWRRLQRFFAVVTTDLPEWNQNPELLNWLTSL